MSYPLQVGPQGYYGVMLHNKQDLNEDQITLICSKYGVVKNLKLTQGGKLVFIDYQEYEEARAFLDELGPDTNFSARVARRKLPNGSPERREIRVRSKSVPGRQFCEENNGFPLRKRVQEFHKPPEQSKNNNSSFDSNEDEKNTDSRDDGQTTNSVISHKRSRGNPVNSEGDSSEDDLSTRRSTGDERLGRRHYFEDHNMRSRRDRFYPRRDFSWKGEVDMRHGGGHGYGYPGPKHLPRDSDSGYSTRSTAGFRRPHQYIIHPVPPKISDISSFLVKPTKHVDPHDEYIYKQMKRSKIRPPLTQVLFSNLPLWFMMGDLFTLISRLCFIVHIDFTYSRQPRKPPHAIVHVTTDEDAQLLIDEFAGVFIDFKEIFVEMI